MKPRHGHALAGIAILIVVQVGCKQEKPGTHPLLDHNPHRVVTISEVTPPNVSNPCKVDFPVTLLRINKKHTIGWYASDHDYWVFFDNGTPIEDGTKLIKVTQGSPPTDYKVALPSSANGMYFTYAIYDADPGPNPSSSSVPCKRSDDDHDTGVNVKR